MDQTPRVAAAPTQEPSDSTVEILARAQRGDQTAAEALIVRALPAVRRWARGRLPSYARMDANTEDVVQDVVFRVLKNLETFQHRTVGGLQAYLRHGVINRIRDLIRGSKRHGVPETLDQDLRDEKPSPLESAILQERLDRFLDALQRLRPQDRQVIVWRIELGYSTDEIAARLGKSKAAAAMSLSRAMARLAMGLKLDEPTK